MIKNFRYGASMEVLRLPCQKKILVNFMVEIATLFSTPITLMIRKKIITYATGLGRTVLR